MKLLKKLLKSSFFTFSLPQSGSDKILEMKRKYRTNSI